MKNIVLRSKIEYLPLVLGKFTYNNVYSPYRFFEYKMDESMHELKQNRNLCFSLKQQNGKHRIKLNDILHNAYPKYFRITLNQPLTYNKFPDAIGQKLSNLSSDNNIRKMGEEQLLI